MCPIDRGERPRLLQIAMAAILALAAACAPAPPPDTRAQDEAAIRATEGAWSAVINTKDVNKFVSYYAPDAVVLAPNEPIASNPEAIKKTIENMLALPGLSMSFRPSTVTVARSGDIGYSYGTYDMSMTGPDGKPVQDKGKYVTVWKKQGDGSWKAVVDTFNSDMPMAPPPPPPPAKGKGQ